RIIPEHPPFIVGEIEICAFVKAVRDFAQHTEAMGVAWRNPELTMVFVVQFDPHILATCGRRGIDIHRHIKNCTPCHTDQLPLGTSLLKMQPSQHASLRTGMVVLHKGQIYTRLAIALDLKGLHEETTMVPKNPGFDNQ